MNLYEILNSIDNTLEKTVNSYNNSIFDNFIDELQRALVRKNLDFDYLKLPKDSIFYVDYIEEGYASCIDTAQKYSEKYEIPVSYLDDSVKGGTYIQFNGKKYINVNKPKGYSFYEI